MISSFRDKIHKMNYLLCSASEGLGRFCPGARQQEFPGSKVGHSWEIWEHLLSLCSFLHTSTMCTFTQITLITFAHGCWGHSFVFLLVSEWSIGYLRKRMWHSFPVATPCTVFEVKVPVKCTTSAGEQCDWLSPIASGDAGGASLNLVNSIFPGVISLCLQRLRD